MSSRYFFSIIYSYERNNNNNEKTRDYYNFSLFTPLERNVELFFNFFFIIFLSNADFLLSFYFLLIFFFLLFHHIHHFKLIYHLAQTCLHILMCVCVCVCAERVIFIYVSSSYQPRSFLLILPR